MNSREKSVDWENVRKVEGSSCIVRCFLWLFWGFGGGLFMSFEEVYVFRSHSVDPPESVDICGKATFNGES